MKKIKLIVIAGILAAGLLSGCGKAEDKKPDPDPSSKGETTIPKDDSEDKDSGEDTTAGVLNKLMGLMGQEDDKVVAELGEGTVNKLEGTEEILGRDYRLTFMKEEVDMSVSYDDNKKITAISIPLPDKKLDVFKKELEQELGAYESTDEDENMEEGSGRKAYVWEAEGASVTLLRAYDTNSLEITPLL